MEQVNEEATLNIGLYKKYAALYTAKKKLEAKAKELGERLREMQGDLIEELLIHEVDRLPLKGGRTIYIDTKIWPKFKNGATREDVVEALKEDGYHELVAEGYNSQRLASVLREFDKMEEPLPKCLDKVIESNPVANLVVRKK